eukprot:TRINITY_DN125_c0_g1_i1.p1 TRINITY_DN125_c0_g1~~TRINITY_DN125_c0_g1_i1.p1  ORF type:complete len:775 (+),score=143.52 TRINITY_DN125_c0_g1_i1:84-2327(+)
MASDGEYVGISEAPFSELDEFQEKPTMSIEDDPRYLAFLQAAVLVDDAKNVRNPDHKMDLHSLRLYRIVNHKWVLFVFRLISIIHMWLALFEKPAYTSLIHPDVAGAIELLILAVYIAEILLLYSTVPTKIFRSDQWTIGFIVLIIINFLDVFTYYLGVTFRWSRYCRPYYLAWHVPLLRSSLKDIRKTIPNVIEVAILVAVLIFLYTIFCVVLYLDTEEGDTYFDGFADGAFNLLVCLTTANYPDVMMPAYSSDRTNAIVFVSFLLIGLYFLMNLVLAVIYNQYRKHLKEGVIRNVLMQREVLDRAFKLIDSPGQRRINLRQWLDFVTVLRPHYSSEKSALLFEALDIDEDGHVSSTEFMKILQILNLKVRLRKTNPNCFEVFCAPIYFSRISEKVKRMVKHRYFEYFMDLIIVANVIYVVIDLNLMFHGGERQQFYIDYYILGIFVIEMFLKMYAFGFREYMRHKWNVFDFVIVVVSLIGIVLEATGYATRSQVRLVVLCRVLRLVRIIGKMERYQVIVGTILQLIPALVTYAGIQYMFYYFFAIVGMDAFGGKITRSDEALRESDFGQSNYYANSFNNLCEAFVTLWELQVVNNWHVITLGYVVVTNKLARVFFICFYLVAVVLVMNIVVAFILEAFVMQWEANQKSRLSHFEDRINAIGVRRAADERGSRRQSETSRGKWVAYKKQKTSEILQSLFSEELAEFDETSMDMLADQLIVYEHRRLTEDEDLPASTVSPRAAHDTP